MSILQQHSKWQINPVPADQNWLCPEGIHEVYALLMDAGTLYLDGFSLAAVIGTSIQQWLPASMFSPMTLLGTITGTRTTTGNRTTAQHNITTAVPPGTDVEAAAVQSGSLSETGTLTVDLAGTLSAGDLVMSALPQGWILTSGEILISPVEFYVRFRRIG